VPAPNTGTCSSSLPASNKQQNFISPFQPLLCFRRFARYQVHCIEASDPKRLHFLVVHMFLSAEKRPQISALEVTMSTPATAPQPVPQHNVTIVPEDRQGEFQARLHDHIAQRAYQHFEQDGGRHGNQDSHWLHAESELLQRIPEVRETGSWLSANATLTDSDTRDLQVLVLRDRAIVAGIRPEQGGAAYLLIKWPVSVDPATAAAYLKGNNLTVTAKHTSSPGGSTSHSANSPAVSRQNSDSKNELANSTPAPQPGKKSD